MTARTAPAHSESPDYLDYADLDPVLLASLRTTSDEDAITAAVEAQLTATAVAHVRHIDLAPVVALRRRAQQSVELRAA